MNICERQSGRLMPCHTCSNNHSLLITTGQEKLGGAEYIDPEMRKSTDFTSWLEKEETAKRLQGKQVYLNE